MNFKKIGLVSVLALISSTAYSVEFPEGRADVNGDGYVRTSDAMLVLQKSVGSDLSHTSWVDTKTTGDVNCDGNITTADAMLIFQYSVGSRIGSGLSEAAFSKCSISREEETIFSAAPSIPEGCKAVEGSRDIGKTLYKCTKGKNYSVIEVDLSKGNTISFGGLEFSHYGPDETHKNNGKYYELYNKKGIVSWKNTYKSSFAVINGQYFRDTDYTHSTSALSFPMLFEGGLIDGADIQDYDKKLLLIDYSNNVRMVTYTDISYRRQIYKTNRFFSSGHYKEGVIGYDPFVFVESDDRWNLIGIKGNNKVLFFISTGLYKVSRKYITNRIINDWGVKKNNILAMDGGASVQYSTNKNIQPSYAYRAIPHVIIIN